MQLRIEGYSHEYTHDRVLCMQFHSLRLSFVGWLIQGGASLYEAQKLLGHSSPSVTEIYSHVQPEEMHAVVGKIHVATN
jgi:integrase/recombinase XerD